MLKHILESHFKLPVTEEFKFHPKRRWRFDYCIESKMIAIEIEGGVWIKGRHTRPQGFINDMEKYNTATAMGYSVIRIQTLDYSSAVKYIEQILSNDNKVS